MHIGRTEMPPSPRNKPPEEKLDLQSVHEGESTSCRVAAPMSSFFCKTMSSRNPCFFHGLFHEFLRFHHSSWTVSKSKNIKPCLMKCTCGFLLNHLTASPFASSHRYINEHTYIPSIVWVHVLFNTYHFTTININLPKPKQKKNICQMTISHICGGVDQLQKYWW